MRRRAVKTTDWCNRTPEAFTRDEGPVRVGRRNAASLHRWRLRPPPALRWRTARGQAVRVGIDISYRILAATVRRRNSDRVLIHPAHAPLPRSKQSRVFESWLTLLNVRTERRWWRDRIITGQSSLGQPVGGARDLLWECA